MKSFAQDIRDVFVPEKKWHYVFHLVVMLVASSYWLGSMVKTPDASLAEIAMYRPRGDNQVYPVISALSQFNLGDPTDALHHGEGTAGTQVVVLLPYALAYRIFGEAGYIVGDVGLSWLYFLTLTLLLRRCNFGNFSSLLIAFAVATRSLQILCNKIGYSVTVILSLFDIGTWEWGFPDLFDMQIFVQRIPRPMGTELFVVLLLYFLLRQWQERTMPSLRRGFAIGTLMALILQGDPFFLSVTGLLLLWVMGWTMAKNQWRVPWHFLGGAAAGALIFGWYFLWQRVFEHPDSAIRFGMADFPRNRIFFLPGFGPLVRVGVVCLLGWIVVMTSRKFYNAQSKASLSATESKSHRRQHAKESENTPAMPDGAVEKSIVTFCLALVAAAWLAQPAQLFLLGKGSQIYHYLIFVLPSVYAYCVIILFCNFLKLAVSPETANALRAFGQHPRWGASVLLSVILLMASIIGMENKLATAFQLTNARQETNVPWVQAGDEYRPSFRALEKEFKQNPALKEVQSFATLCYEVNFLLAGFHEKRAYLPDNAYSTLSDEQLEDRLLQTMKILQLPPEHLGEVVQANFMLNYWLGCAKYWLTSDYQFSTRDDYTNEQWSFLLDQPKQTPWYLCLPKSEIQRLSEKYRAVLQRESDPATLPDTIIVGLERNLGLIPNPKWYRGLYTNQLFSVFIKNSGTELTQVSDSPSP